MTWFKNKVPKSLRPFKNLGKNFRPHLRVERLFFDRAKVIAMIGKKNAAAMSRVGAFIRRRAQTRILLRRKGPSTPGSPPHVHAPAGEKFKTLRNIHFEYHKYMEQLVVGPHRVATKGNRAVLAAGNTVPQVLEFGGGVQIKEEKPEDTPNVTYEWRKEGVYNNPAKRAKPKRKKKFGARRSPPRRKWQKMKKFNKNKPLLKRVRRARIQKRPFMAVALRQEIAAGTIPKQWGSQVLGG